MAKMFGLHTFELRPGVDEKEFAKLITDLLFPAIAELGWKGRILKGDRGERDGKLAIILEIPSVEQRDRFIPVMGQPMTEEARRLMGSKLDEYEKKVDAFVSDWSFTDYVEL